LICVSNKNGSAHIIDVLILYILPPYLIMDESFIL
jgi:hypothetical protein